jgi:hypothetical protein
VASVLTGLLCLLLSQRNSPDPARLDRSIDQIAEGFKFQKRPSAADIFEETFLRRSAVA